MNELCRRGASELAALIAAGDVSSREAVEAHLARIDEVNGTVNAVTLSLRDGALAAADAADATAKEDRGALHGVPFTIKENVDCMGSPTTQGIPALADFLPERDAAVVARMKGAGGVPLARTNLPEMGMRIDTDNPLRGRTRNPWNPALTPGGSSGGEAAALATGMTPIGIGNDIGGSLRNPAYCCGIAALKPTVGRIPLAAVNSGEYGGMSMALLTDGPMARSVADLRLGLGIMAGRDAVDPQSVDAPLAGPLPAPRRAALVTSIPGCELPAATLAAVRRGGEALAERGWEVEEAGVPELDLVNHIWGTILSIDMEAGLDDTKALVRPITYEYLLRIRDHFDPSKLPNAIVHTERTRLRAAWSAFFADYAVAVGPTWCSLPFACDADLHPERGLDVLLRALRFITPGNVLGIPAVALPTGVADGLPTGIQIYADLYREDLCLLAAETIEAACAMPTPIDPVA
jgi:amidase